jgi:adenylate cyclase
VHVKNIERPIRIWKWHPGTGAEPGVGESAPAKATEKPAQPKPSVAVLPFANMSGDAEQEYFSDGISEDIITDLSKIGGLVVIARNSSFAYKGKNVDIRTVGRELGVKAVLEGSIRRAGNRVRITAQLIDAATGGHLWADRYDRDLTDIFAVQDEVTGQIVSALKVTLTPREKTAIEAVGTENSEALDCVLRARRLLPRASKDAVGDVMSLLSRAVELDPNYARAYSTMAMAHIFDFQNSWGETAKDTIEIARQNVEIALAKDPNDAYGHYVHGIVLGYLGQRPRAILEFDKAAELSPNDAAATNAQGVSQLFEGYPDKALPLIEQAIRLDPAGSQQYIHFLGMANMLLGKMETAAALFRERILLVPETDLSRALYASTLGHLGRLDEARAVWRELMQINPKYSFMQHMSRLLFVREQDSALIADGLAKAGLPD